MKYTQTHLTKDTYTASKLRKEVRDLPQSCGYRPSAQNSCTWGVPLSDMQTQQRHQSQPLCPQVPPPSPDPQVTAAPTLQVSSHLP